MIKKVTRKVIKEVIEVISSTEHCDICGKVISVDDYKEDDIIIKRHQGMSYPEAGWGTNEWFDICEECWDKVKGFIEGLGGKIQSEDWDY